MCYFSTHYTRINIISHAYEKKVANTIFFFFIFIFHINTSRLLYKYSINRLWEICDWREKSKIIVCSTNIIIACLYVMFSEHMSNNKNPDSSELNTYEFDDRQRSRKYYKFRMKRAITQQYVIFLRAVHSRHTRIDWKFSRYRKKHQITKLLRFYNNSYYIQIHISHYSSYEPVLQIF